MGIPLMKTLNEILEHCQQNVINLQSLMKEILCLEYRKNYKSSEGWGKVDQEHHIQIPK